MATAATSRAATSPRRTPSNASPAASSIAKGATARSAVSPKVNASLNGISRRPSSRPSSAQGGASLDNIKLSREALLAGLKLETEEKEELLVRIQNKEQTISELTTENDNISTALNVAESRLAELYAEQARIEEETAARLALVDRLRAQVQELEKEKRDVLRRYNEQTVTFDAERQSFYDNEQHLKSRIQSLVNARKAAANAPPATPIDDGIPSESEDQHEPEQPPSAANAPVQKPAEDEDNEPAEMTALRLELSTLSTSYTSLQTTVQYLTSQLLDLKRVNNHLQEENESYNILLRERTISGQFDILRTVGTRDSDEDDDGDGDGDGDGDADAEDGGYELGDRRSLRSTDRTPLDPVDEVAEDLDSTLLGDSYEQCLDESSSGTRSRDRTRRQARGRRDNSPSYSPKAKGESLADLPITGPGLDLAAELGRAENQAILEGRAEELEEGRGPVLSGYTKNNRRSKRVSADPKMQGTISRTGDMSTSPSSDVDALRNEVKSLKDANKALSLYASKIIDRIIAQEGFEHVLAVDYDNKTSPVRAKNPSTAPLSFDSSPKRKPRPQSAMFFPRTEPVASPPPHTSPTLPAESTATTKSQRRSMSFDWKSFSVFGSSSEKKLEANPNLRPLTLRPGAAVVGARKLDTHEDEDDRRERERMNAVLKLMGIEKPEQPASPTVSGAASPSGTPAMTAELTSPKLATSRFSFFRSRSTNSDNASINSGNSGNNANATNPSLTQEALERADAETSLAALDERERVLSAELAKGSSGGFTDLPKRNRGEEWRSRRSKRSGESGSGSTVWSAGMSTHKEAESEDEHRRGRE